MGSAPFGMLKGIRLFDDDKWPNVADDEISHRRLSPAVDMGLTVVVTLTLIPSLGCG